MAHIQGTDEDDRIFGTRGDDLVEGLDGDDLITERSGENTIDGGAGDDRIIGGSDADTIDGGSGSDRIWGRNGDDILIYNLSENIGSTDYYDGGYDNDTLRLILTQEQFDSPEIQADIARFEQFLSDQANPNTAGGTVFEFTAFDLTVRNFETLDVVIENSSELPTLSIDDPTVTEGDPVTTITFTVTRSGDTSAASTVDYIVFPGSATFPEDYNDSLDPLTGTLTFAAGETSKTITLDVTDDQVPEDTQDFSVTLSGETNASITKAVGTGTILDDDLPAFSIDDPTVNEGDPGDVTIITFTVTRDGDNGSASTVDYTVAPNTAVTPGDYSAIDPLTGTLSFAVGETSKTITLDVTDDQIPEGTEEFTVSLSGETNAVIDKAVGIGTILDDDLPTISIDDPTVTEGDPGGIDATITFTVTRSGDNSLASTVDYTVVPGTATTPEDYIALDALSGTLTFAAGETTKTITLDVTDDLIAEVSEDFSVTLSGATNAVIERAEGTGTILDDDLPALTIDDPTVTEGDPGGIDATITFTVIRSGDNGVASTVDYTVVPGTAGTPGDYTAIDPLTGTLTFTAGETTKTITLDVTDDLIAEVIENFSVTLSGATNADIDKALGTGTIMDDDLPTLTIDDQTIIEGNPCGVDATITFTVTRSGDNGLASTVAYTVLPGTATTPEDYSAIDSLTGTLSFAANETTKTITLDLTDDMIAEETETFTVELSAPTNAVIDKAVGTGTILDDDLPTVIWTSSDNSLANILINGSLNVGTDISAATPTDHWTNGTGDQLWSTDGNWEDGIKPITTDRLAFDVIDSGGTNIVDQNFLISSIDYTGAGDHITDIVGDNQLEITTLVNVGIDNSRNIGSLRIEDVSVSAFENTINIGRKVSGIDTPVTGQLTLANGSGLDVTTTTGDIFIGFNQTNLNVACGELNALESAATVNLNVDDLVVGRATSTGVAHGTLRWNQTEAIQANDVYFGWGSKAVSVLDVPAGGTFRLGTDLDRSGNLWLAYDDTAAAGVLSTTLDLRVTNPTFEAYLDGTLTIGENAAGTGDTDGTLALGSNSTLDMQSTFGDVLIGVNRTNTGTVSGELNATQGTLNADIDQFIVGFSSGTGVAIGAFTMGDSASTTDQVNITANQVIIGSGVSATGTFDMRDGALTVNTMTIGDNGTFLFTGGWLEAGIVNGTINQAGGTLSPIGIPGNTTINGDYNLSSNGILEIDLAGSGTPGVAYDQLDINGVVNLNADAGTGGALDLLLGFTPTAGNTFTILDNDASDLIIGSFEGLADNGIFDVVNGNDTVTFQIDYDGGDGNDVVLTTTNVVTAVPVVTMARAASVPMVEQQVQPAETTNADWLTGGVGDEPLLFDQVAANENNLDWNPVSPLGLMLLGSMDTSTELVDSNPVTVELSSGLDSGLVDDSPLIGLSLDTFGYSEGIV